LQEKIQASPHEVRKITITVAGKNPRSVPMSLLEPEHHYVWKAFFYPVGLSYRITESFLKIEKVDKIV
jgi:hypothetical protein